MYISPQSKADLFNAAINYVSNIKTVIFSQQIFGTANTKAKYRSQFELLPTVTTYFLKTSLNIPLCQYFILLNLILIRCFFLA
jgi:hypothetical protein